MLRRLAPVATALIAVLAVPAAASAVAPDPNPWLNRHFLNIAHQGGEDEAPSNTLYAFKSAVAERGADMLELDVNLTADGHLVVIHDDTVSRTTNGPQTRPASQVRDLTLDQVQALDAGYWFRPDSYSHGAPPEEYLLRGIRTGDKAPPPGYAPRDFRIPTLEEVLDAFPTTPINIEIKMVKTQSGLPPGGGCTSDIPPYCDDATASIPVAEELATVLTDPDYAWRDDIIVVSFADSLIEEFHSLAPEVALAPGVTATTLYALSGTPPNPDVAAFQVPPKQLGFDVPALIFGQGAHQQGYAVHVWPNGDEPDGEASYDRLIKLGIDGYMSSQPLRLHNFLCSQEIPRPNGADRCPNPPAEVAAVKTCKKGKKLKKGKCVAKKRKKGKKKRR